MPGVKVGAIYGRVSTDDLAQTEHGTLEQQENICRELVRGHEMRTGERMEVRYVLIEERGISGATQRRPKYQELLRLIVTRKIDFVVAKEVSRISRSTKDFIEFMELCGENDVALYIRGYDIDPTTTFGRMLFQFMAMLAELERNMIANRTRESIRSAAINNAKINGGSILLGFEPHPESKGYWIVNEEKIKHVVYMMQHFLETGSLKQTLDQAKSKGIKNRNGRDFSYTTLKRLLQSEKYIGLMRVPGDGRREPTIVRLTHGCVVPTELFHRVQEKIRQIDESKIKNRVGKRIYLLSGLLRFEDGSSFSGSSGTGRSSERFHYYRSKSHEVLLDADAWLFSIDGGTLGVKVQ